MSETEATRQSPADTSSATGAPSRSAAEAGISSTSVTGTVGTTIPDLIGALADLSDIAVGVVGAISPEQLHLPTPCTAYDVGELTAHLTGAVRRLRGIALDEPFGELDSSLDPDVPLAVQVRAAADEAIGAWRSADLSSPRVVPWATLTAGEMLEMYLMEVATHSWDLATATGQPHDWDEALGEAVLRAAPHYAPADQYRGPDPMPFLEPVPVPPDADPYTRLAGFLGRQV